MTDKTTRKNRYTVIGGQYEYYDYGSYPTLVGAKRVATKNMEYWDNWQGWHKPSVYRIEDTHEIETHGFITHCDGEIIRVPNAWAQPVA